MTPDVEYTNGHTFKKDLKTMTPHPLRCETCDNEQCGYHSNTTENKNCSIRFFVRAYGCASHSSAPSEQEIRKDEHEIVLDKLNEWIRLYRIEMLQYITKSNSYHCDRFQREIAELRSKQGEP